MVRLVFDIGEARLRAAYWDDILDNSSLLSLNPGAKNTWLPAMIWAPPGPFCPDENLLGPEAEDELAGDPNHVFGLMELLHGKALGDIEATHEELLAWGLRGLRDQLMATEKLFSGGDPPRHLIVPIKWGQFTKAQHRMLERAARIAGFTRFKTVPSLVAAATWMKEYVDEPPEHLVVLDCGAGSADWAYLKHDGKGYTHVDDATEVHRDLGGNQIEKMLLEHVKSTLFQRGSMATLTMLRETSEPVVLRQLREIKEIFVHGGPLGTLWFGATQGDEGPLVGDEEVTLDPDRFGNELVEHFLNPLQLRFGEFISKINARYDLATPPVLLCGGASRIPGMKKLIEELWCEVITVPDPDNAFVLGATLPIPGQLTSPFPLDDDSLPEEPEEIVPELPPLQEIPKPPAWKTPKVQLAGGALVLLLLSAIALILIQGGEGAPIEEEKEAAKDEREGEASRFKPPPQRLPWEIRFETSPSGAKVYAHLTEICTTPCLARFHVKPGGEKRFRFEKEGFLPEERTIWNPAHKLELKLENRFWARLKELGFVRIKTHRFSMGSPEDERGRASNERAHQVTLTKEIWAQQAEVSQGEWRAIMGSEPWHFRNCGDSCPVESVNWYEAITYANALSEREGLETCYQLSACKGTPGDGCKGKNSNCKGDYRCNVVFRGLDCEGFRLPTESEWEFLAKGGQFKGPPLDAMAWYQLNSKKKPHFRKKKIANSLSLFDMQGNVWEWVWDNSAPYPRGRVTDPTGPRTGTKKVSRGGSWSDKDIHCRTSYRRFVMPTRRSNNRGFRLVRTERLKD